MEKKCVLCKADKDIELFSERKGSSDGKQDICKGCMSTYRKKHYATNPEYYKKKTREARERRRREREEIKQGLQCKVCGEDRWWVLEFHHRDPKQKEYSIGRKSTRSIRKMTEEIAKCDVLCANCHKDLHYQERLGVNGIDSQRMTDN